MELPKKINRITSKKISKSLLWYLFASVFSKAIGFLAMPIYTRLMTQQDYGYLNTYNAWINILSVIVGFGLQSAIIRVQKIYKDDESKYRKFYSTTLVESFCLFGFVSSIVIILNYRGIFKVDVSLLYIVLIQSYLTFLIGLFAQILVLNNEYKKYAFLNVFYALMGLTFATLLLVNGYFEPSILNVIYPKIWFGVLIVLPISSIILFKGKLIFDKNIWIQNLKYCIPLIFHTIALNILAQFDRIMLGKISGYAISAQYSAMCNCALAISIIVVAFENAWKSKFYKLIRQNKFKQINSSAQIFISSLTLLGILLIMVMPELVKIILEENYWSGIHYINILIMGYIFSFYYDFPVHNEYYEGHTKYIAVVSIGACFINVGLNYLLIPTMQGTGAALATLVAFLFQFVVHLMLSRKYNSLLFPLNLFVKDIIQMLIAGGVYYFFLNNMIIRWFIGILFLLLYYFKNRDAIRGIQ